MITNKNDDPPRGVTGLTGEQRKTIDIFLKGMVYGWCESKREEPFFAHNLVGGVNWNWKDTPLQCIYDKQTTSGETAYTVAAQEAGRLLKKVIMDDDRKFTCTMEGRDTCCYTWDGDFPKKQ